MATVFVVRKRAGDANFPLMPTNEYDAVIIGGGPSGTAAAAVLAEADRNVVILEKDAFPRYHIGESLIPYNYFPLERIGMLPALQASDFVRKHSVQFVGESGKVSRPFYFQQHMDHPCSQTWQVDRDDFDRMLLDNAVAKGAEHRGGVKVERLRLDDRGAVTGVETDQGVFEAPVTVDASGRNCVAMNQFGWRVPDEVLRKHAMWTYYEGAVRDEGIDEGATTVAYVGGKNWFWYIPLRDNRVSVGLVGAKDYLFRGSKYPQEIWDREIRNNAWIAEHLAGGTRVADVQVTSDFSYRSRHCARDGLVLAGDAFAFLDPVFSSGVFLALYSGVMAGETILDLQGDYRGEHFAEYGRRFCGGLEAMRQLVYAFYHDDFNFGIMLKRYPDMRGDLTDCLIGHVEKDFGPLFRAIAEFTELPEPLAHGGPLV